jgi:hypothetical protein
MGVPLPSGQIESPRGTLPDVSLTQMTDTRLGRTVAEVLDSEFSRLRAEGKKGLETLTGQARFLKIDKTALSRFRSGRRPLTRVRAEQISALLRTKAGRGEVDELADELVAARRVLAAHQVAVEKWFSNEELNESLLLVEFREPPAVRLDGPTQSLVDAVGTAIAKGLSYAMLFPFNLDAGAPRLPVPVRLYLAEVKDSLFETYYAIQNDLLLEVYEANRGKSDLNDKLSEATRRFRLYGLKTLPGDTNNQPADSRCPAIGYRLFFLKYRERDRAEQWEWVSANSVAPMIKKDSSKDELRAVAVRFSPIIEYWEQKHDLPTTAELLAFSEEIENQRGYRASLDLGEPLWEVIDKRSDEEIVGSFIQNQELPN